MEISDRSSSMFEHRCLRSFSGIWWKNFLNNSEVRRTMDDSEVQPSEEKTFSVVASCFVHGHGTNILTCVVVRGRYRLEDGLMFSVDDVVNKYGDVKQWTVLRRCG